jgi:hypothetical protein
VSGNVVSENGVGNEIDGKAVRDVCGGGCVWNVWWGSVCGMCGGEVCVGDVCGCECEWYVSEWCDVGGDVLVGVRVM